MPAIQRAPSVGRAECVSCCSLRHQGNGSFGATMRIQLIGFLSAAVLCTPSASAAPVTLVRDGRASAVIVVPDGPPQRAVAELRDYIEKATGAKLDIVPESGLTGDPPRGSRIFVGACQAAKRVVDLAQLQPEGFVIKTEGNDLFIVGRDKTVAGLDMEGTHYGVCEFLEALRRRPLAHARPARRNRAQTTNAERRRG